MKLDSNCDTECFADAELIQGQMTFYKAKQDLSFWYIFMKCSLIHLVL